MFCNNCKPSVNLSSEGHRITKILQTLTYCFLFLIVLKLLFGDFNGFFNDILTLILLILTFIQTNYFMAGMLIFFLLFQSFYIFIFVGLILQDSILGMITIELNFSFFYLIITLLSLVLYCALIYYTFEAYKEYKALYIEQKSNPNNNYSK